MTTCTLGCGGGAAMRPAPHEIGRMFDPELTTLMDAATLRGDIVAPTLGP